MTSSPLSKKPSFLLEKWYLDCVAENGDSAIVYVATLHWNKLLIHYGSLLTVLSNRIHSAFSLRRCRSPQLDADSVTLALSHLGIEGTWRALRAPVRRKVFESNDGSVDWHCHQPISQVELLIRGDDKMSGLGYAESLTLSVLPWRLPLEELHWGRFLSDQHAIVWIDWRGLHQWRTVIQDGEEQPVQSLSESGMQFTTNSKLDLDRGKELRRGPLGQTVFGGISRLAGLLPRNMLSVEECKWRSRGVLQRGDEQVSGWAIHEVVKWKA